MPRAYLVIGLDDIDSLYGGCTTHFATEVVEAIKKYNGTILDYPRLIRLNPDIPWKTRGNGSVAIEFSIPRDLIMDFINEVKKRLISYIISEDSLPASTQPGVIILNISRLSQFILELLYQFSLDALHKVISRDKLNHILMTLEKSESIVWRYSIFGKRGLIGALAAIGNTLPYDHTYELIVYRDLEDRGSRYDMNTVKKLIAILKEAEDEYSFAHVDPENNKLLVSPAGFDPVLMGIRGENPCKLYSIFRRIIKKLRIKYARWIVYVTNQGTDEHLYQSCNSIYPEVYTQLNKLVTVTSKPSVIEGSHVMVPISTLNKSLILYSYYESGRLRYYILKNLDKDVKIYIGGAVKPSKFDGLIVNIEKFIQIADTKVKRIYPKCPQCLVYMSSIGYSKGLRCKKCGYQVTNFGDFKITSNFSQSNIFLPPLRSIKHLAKPLKRYGREKRVRARGLRSIRFSWIYEN